MTDHDVSSKPADPSAVALGHELDMANVRVLSLAIGALALLGMLGIVIAWVELTLLGRGTEVQTAGDPPALEGLPEIRAPLDPTQQESLRELRAWETATLNRYSWMNQKAGIAAIPIQRAIELASERGLPAWSSPQQSQTGSESP
jgi:hypothetical protein